MLIVYSNCLTYMSNEMKLTKKNHWCISDMHVISQKSTTNQRNAGW